MSAIFAENDDGRPERRFGAAGLFIGSVLYDNSAAKFWSGLVDEIAADYPSCTSASLAAASDSRLERRLLRPQAALQEDMDALAGRDLEEVFREALAELSILGGPRAIRAQLQSGTETILDRDLPLECADAELFDYLLVWLVEWAGIPESRWNDERVDGRFDAEALGADRVYGLAFEIERRHLSEGLYEKRVVLRFSRTRPPRV